MFDALLGCLKAAGRLQVIALFSHDPTVDTGKLLFQERVIGGSIGYCDDHERVIELVQQGKIDLEPFITRRIDAKDIATEGYEYLMAHKDTQVKIIAHM